MKETIMRSQTNARPCQSARTRRAIQHAAIEALEGRQLLSFSPATSYPAGSAPRAVATADFNGDGRLDLAVANTGSNTVSVLLGDSGGTFQAAQTSATNAGPRSVAAGDFNADGIPDLATANDSGVSVLLGTGNGTFRTPSAIPFGMLTGSVA